MRAWWRKMVCGPVAAVVLLSSGCVYMHVQHPLGENFDKTLILYGD